MLVGLLSANTTGCSFTSAQARSTAWWGEVAGWAPSSEGREGLRVYPHLIKGGGHGADADEDGRFDRFHDVHQRLHLRCFVRKVALCVGGGTDGQRVRRGVWLAAAHLVVLERVVAGGRDQALAVHEVDAGATGRWGGGEGVGGLFPGMAGRPHRFLASATSTLPSCATA